MSSYKGWGWVWLVAAVGAMLPQTMATLGFYRTWISILWSVAVLFAAALLAPVRLSASRLITVVALAFGVAWLVRRVALVVSIPAGSPLAVRVIPLIYGVVLVGLTVASLVSLRHSPAAPWAFALGAAAVALPTALALNRAGLGNPASVALIGSGMVLIELVGGVAALAGVFVGTWAVGLIPPRPSTEGRASGS